MLEWHDLERRDESFPSKKTTLSRSPMKKSPGTTEGQRLTVSLKTLSTLLDAHRSSVRRWLDEAGIRPIVIGRGRNAAIRYHWQEIQAWLNSRQRGS